MSVKRYDPEDWGGLHMAAKEKGDWVCYEEWEKLEAENAALKARVAELESMKPVYCVVSEYYDDRMNELYTHHDEPVPMADNFVLYRKDPSNEA